MVNTVESQLGFSLQARLGVEVGLGLRLAFAVAIRFGSGSGLGLDRVRVRVRVIFTLLYLWGPQVALRRRHWNKGSDEVLFAGLGFGLKEGQNRVRVRV